MSLPCPSLLSPLTLPCLSLHSPSALPSLSLLSRLFLSLARISVALSHRSLSLYLLSSFSPSSFYLSPGSAWRPLIDLNISLPLLSLFSLLFLSLARISVAASHRSVSLAFLSPSSPSSFYLSPESAWRPLIDLNIPLPSLSLFSPLFLSLARISVAPFHRSLSRSPLSLPSLSPLSISRPHQRGALS